MPSGFQMSWNGIAESYWVPQIPKIIVPQNNPQNARAYINFYGYSSLAAYQAGIAPINRSDCKYILKGEDFINAQKAFYDNSLPKWCLDYAKATKDQGSGKSMTSFFETATEV